MKINKKEKPVEPATSHSTRDSVGNEQDSSSFIGDLTINQSESTDVQKITEGESVTITGDSVAKTNDATVVMDVPKITQSTCYNYRRVLEMLK